MKPTTLLACFFFGNSLAYSLAAAETKRGVEVESLDNTLSKDFVKPLEDLSKVEMRQNCNYTVKEGDTLTSIAADAGTTTARIKQLNPGLNPNAILVGQVIRIC
ncbi:LysM domain-containing protein [Pyrenophora tritici-repentis]|uniref:LysM domain-containing protein n=1 Tax=Pyrenophora tritici-repentis TaxID=45151 RepID=A0A5M9L748_9PLEO|nr:LysM domain-containing protein [Pyrenophora tritici-repentis]KAA8620601.1 LysM domain-containing protein [Pyrenophora tritici-repentis]KAF7451175.1 hypothetical protein A1F99_029520 [Pyrenophora tritici-repentis]KAF7451181.1 hypothetical protein A1F99_029580 [Pyrenophora tritici-repentis]KAF7564210.1 hypothetical protein PtrM4_153790 [Pyrenophora tritici-repentis]